MASDISEPVTSEPEPVGRGPKRSGRGGRDMAISLIVLLIPVAIIVALFRFYGGEDVVVTDPQPAFDAARAASAFPISEPKDLADGWRPISNAYGVRDGVATLRVGYVTPSDRNMQLVETDGESVAAMSRELGAKVVPGGSAPAGWQAYQVREGERALVKLDPDRTVIVTGTATESELAEFVAALV